MSDETQRRAAAFAASRASTRRSKPLSFLLFAMTGAVGTACQYVTLIALVHFAGIGVVLASTIGAVVGALFNFVMNHHVTFASGSSVYETGPRYIVLVLVSFANNALLIYVMSELWHWNYLLAQVITTGIVFLCNYLLSSLWVFAESAES